MNFSSPSDANLRGSVELLRQAPPLSPIPAPLKPGPNTPRWRVDPRRNTMHIDTLSVIFSATAEERRWRSFWAGSSGESGQKSERVPGSTVKTKVMDGCAGRRQRERAAAASRLTGGPQYSPQHGKQNLAPCLYDDPRRPSRTSPPALSTIEYGSTPPFIYNLQERPSPCTP